MFDAVFNSARPLQMTEDLYQDLECLPVDLIWRELEKEPNFVEHEWGHRWLTMFKWLLPESKVFNITCFYLKSVFTL